MVAATSEQASDGRTLFRCSLQQWAVCGGTMAQIAWTPAVSPAATQHLVPHTNPAAAQHDTRLCVLAIRHPPVRLLRLRQRLAGRSALLCCAAASLPPRPGLRNKEATLGSAERRRGWRGRCKAKGALWISCRWHLAASTLAHLMPPFGTAHRKRPPAAPSPPCVAPWANGAMAAKPCCRFRPPAALLTSFSASAGPAAMRQWQRRRWSAATGGGCGAGTTCAVRPRAPRRLHKALQSPSVPHAGAERPPIAPGGSARSVLEHSGPPGAAAPCFKTLQRT